MNSATGKPSEGVEFFLDEGIIAGPLIEALRAAGETVHIHSDYFQAGTIDPDWLPTVVARGWIILTKDAKIRYRHSESSIVMNAGGRLFVVIAKGMNGRQMATMVVAALPAVHKFLATYPAPFIAKIKRPHTVERWVDAVPA